MIPNYPAQFKATGRADLIYDGICLSSGHFNAAGGVNAIHIWELN